MDTDPNEARWALLERPLAQLEADYRRQRLRPGGRTAPSGREAEWLLETLEEVCRLYLGAGDDLRQRVRDFFARSYALPNYLLGVASRAVERLAAGGGADAALLALAAVSVEDLHIDFRDTYVILGILYHRMVRLGIDPGPLFARLAALSSDRAREAGWRPMREVLERFETLRFFKDDVAPYLHETRLALEGP